MRFTATYSVIHGVLLRIHPRVGVVVGACACILPHLKTLPQSDTHTTTAGVCTRQNTTSLSTSFEPFNGNRLIVVHIHTHSRNQIILFETTTHKIDLKNDRRSYESSAHGVVDLFYRDHFAERNLWTCATPKMSTQTYITNAERGV